MLLEVESVSHYELFIDPEARVVQWNRTLGIHRLDQSIVIDRLRLVEAKEPVDVLDLRSPGAHALHEHHGSTPDVRTQIVHHPERGRVLSGRVVT